MQMTPEEIAKSYKQSKRPNMQIGILADMNLCTKEEIIEILETQGVKANRRRGRQSKTIEKSEPAAVVQKEDEKTTAGTETYDMPDIVKQLIIKEMSILQDRMDVALYNVRHKENLLRQAETELKRIKSRYEALDSCINGEFSKVALVQQEGALNEERHTQAV